MYFDRLFPMGVEAMLEAVDLVKAGKAPRIKQDETKASYEGRCGPDNAHIDWGRPWQEIDRLIRGCNPAPGAWSKLDGKTVKIFEAKPLPAKDPKGIAGKMGEIVAIEHEGFSVVCADGRFKVTRVQPADGPKIAASEFTTNTKLNPRNEVFMTPPPASAAKDFRSRLAARSSRNPTSKSLRRPRSGRSSTSRASGWVSHRKISSRIGHYKAKVSMDYIRSLQDKPNGKLILVSAITPTPAGEGKTTTTVGLTDALNHIGKKAMLCLREPSLGPSFGMKGGAAGGGYAQVVPMEDINLHFTGDFHAITVGEQSAGRDDR